MGRMAVVGCEASGKTVFLSSLCDQYRPDAKAGRRLCLVPENKSANSFAQFQRRQMRALRQWPPATNPGRTVELEWTLRDGEKVLAEVSMLEFGGETFRAAFRGEDSEAGEERRKQAVKELTSYLNGADSVVLLVSLKELFREAGEATAEEFERDTEALWVTRGLLDFVQRKLPCAAFVIALTQADRYRSELAALGGAAAALAARWPTVRAVAPDVPVIAVASVSGVDGEGRPEENFRTDGVLAVMRELARQEYGSTEVLGKELAALKAELEGFDAAARHAAYQARLRKFANALEAFKAAAAIGGEDRAREEEALALALERFRAVAKATAPAPKPRPKTKSKAKTKTKPPRAWVDALRRQLRFRWPFVAALALAGLVALGQYLRPGLYARAFARVEAYLAASSASEAVAAAAIAAPAVEPAGSAPVAGTNSVAAVTNAVAEPQPVAEQAAAVTNLPPVAIAVSPVTTNLPPAVVMTNRVLPMATLPSVTAEIPTREAREKRNFAALCRGADQGLVTNQFKVGSIYLKGKDSIPQDLAKARKYLQLAATAGHPRAQFLYATMLEAGQGGKKDLAEAGRFYQLSATHGEGDALYRLGVDCYNRSVKQTNSVEKVATQEQARGWFERAQAAGCKQKDLEPMLKLLRPQDAQSGAAPGAETPAALQP